MAEPPSAGQATQPAAIGTQRVRLRRDAAVTLIVTSAAVMLLAWTLAEFGHADWRVAAAAAVCLALISGAAWRGLPTYPYQRFGLANILTTARAGLTALVGALIFEATAPGPPEPTALAWIVTAIAAIALLLDALDGCAARRRSTTSAYGARFDMEIDTLLILFLAMLVFAAGKTGIWVLGIGLMRYLFVGAQQIMSQLRQPLPASRRRKTICALQGVALCAALAPVTGPALAQICVATALIGLVYSFTVDIVYLLRSAAPCGISRP